MADGSFVTWITGPAPPVWLAFFAYGVWWIRGIPDRKHRNTEADLADDTIIGNQWARFQKEIARVDARCERLEASEEKCRDELADAKRRIAELEGYDEGQGRARQEAAGIVARERLRDKGAGR